MARTPAKKTPAKKKAPAKPRAKKETPVVEAPRSRHPIVHSSIVAAERARATPNFAPVPAAKRRRRR